MKKIAIVTPELAGLFKNGGIGTNYFYRAHFLREKAGWQVTILYTGQCAAADAVVWRDQHGQSGIQLEILPEATPGQGWPAIHSRARAVHHWLAAGTWEEIHFPEYQANGLVCIQAKRAGLAYQNTRIVVTMHSSSAWCREAMRQWSATPTCDDKLDYAERYCCEQADTLISPSQHLMQWAEQKRWKLPVDRHVLPSLYEAPSTTTPSAPLNPRHLIFFGRLEARKGLALFCDAMDRLTHDGIAPARIDFLGKFGWFADRTSEKYLSQRVKAWRTTTTRIYKDFDRAAALAHIRQSGGLVVIPSLTDNLPYTVIECIGNQFPFIASNTGGIPELAHPAVLFAPNAVSLANMLANWRQHPPTGALHHPYQIDAVRKHWDGYVTNPWVARSEPLPPIPPVAVYVRVTKRSQHLQAVLESLKQQTFSPFSVTVLDNQANFEGTNDGWLTFITADTVPHPEMIATLVHALHVSGADCATCGSTVPSAPLRDSHKSGNAEFVPLGPCLAAGWRENVFGGPVLIVKKNVFEALGGFGAEHDEVAAWQFLIKLSARGFQHIVVPERLYTSHMNSAEPLPSNEAGSPAVAILETYRRELTGWTGSVIDHHILASHLQKLKNGTAEFLCAPESQHANTDKIRAQWLLKLQQSTIKRLRTLASWLEGI